MEKEEECSDDGQELALHDPYEALPVEVNAPQDNEAPRESCAADELAAEGRTFAPPAALDDPQTRGATDDTLSGARRRRR